MATSAIGGIKGQAAQQTPNTVAEPDAFDKMDLGQFIKVLVAEMQNQDPLNPMENSEILQQIAQMRAIASNDKMTSTLRSLQIQQDMAAGTTLLHQMVTGLNTEGKMITGTVDKVSVADSKVQLHVGYDTIEMKNVSAINGVSRISRLEEDIETGNALLSEMINGVNTDGKTVAGKVERVTVAGDRVQLHVKNDAIDLNDVTSVNGIDSSVQFADYRQTGGSLVGRSVRGLNVEGKMISGQVEKIAAVDGKVQLQVGKDTIDLEKVREIDDLVPETTR